MSPGSSSFFLFSFFFLPHSWFVFIARRRIYENQTRRRKKTLKTVDGRRKLDIAQWKQLRGEHRKRKTGKSDGNLFLLLPVAFFSLPRSSSTEFYFCFCVAGYKSQVKKSFDWPEGRSIPSAQDWPKSNRTSRKSFQLAFEYSGAGPSSCSLFFVFQHARLLKNCA